MTTSDQSDLSIAVAAAKAAFAAASAARDGPLRARAKSVSADLVTDADGRAEAAAVAVLETHRPDDAVIGEEGADHRGATARRWFVDGIDGTFNFLSGIPHWCVAVGLEQDSDPVAAAVYDPTGDELFLSGPGTPATANGAVARVRTGRALEAAAVATYLRPDKSEHRDVTLSRLVDEIGIVRAGGAGTLELAWVAAGRVDAWAQPNVSPWDWVPGAALVRAAGGEAVILDGDPAWHVAGPSGLVAALAAIVPRR
jgi:myo-inositol-1(or 4)-monophosphatase